MSPSPSRRRGGQPGNDNAAKPGFYTQALLKADLSGLQDSAAADLKDEITMLRVFIRQVLRMSQDITDLSAAVDLLRALSLATTSLTRLIKTQHFLSASTDEFGQALKQALAEIAVELNLSVEDPSAGQPALGPPPGQLPAPSTDA